ncbi:XRE family transcriptional regulator [Pseudonocardia nigra]|uniref:XRE family transcriptional regulator n=1 Tax=Pseudonocardia nigra TaxID=1921578 RepID=UPI001C5F7A76|nr:XRE family transcriptional regulator [Pseudonocardia nigra]
MEPNRQLRAARGAHPSARTPGHPLSRGELAELMAAEIYRRTGRVAPVDAHYVAKLERGAIRWPGEEYRAALRAVLGIDTDAVLGFHPPAHANSGGASLPPAYVPDGLLELAARAEVSDVGAAAVESLEEVAELLARAYASTPPNELLVQVRRRAAEVSALLDRRTTLAQRRRLLVTGGWLALLGATVLVDLGERAGAAAARASAASLGRETEHPELVAWAVEVATWTALIDQDWPRAARLAAQGEALAPTGTSAAVQLSAQRARAAARLGDGATVRAGLARAEAGVDHQCGGRPRDHHFVFDGRKLDGYTATSLAWLGDPAGEHVAREVAARYADGPARRLATARVDLGLILARDGRPDEAAHLGMLAADSGRLVPSNAWRVAELDDVLADHRDVAEVAELHERVRGARSRQGP